MTEVTAPEAPEENYGALIEPATLKIERLLPGPIDRVWAYLTESDLRRQWLASGDMSPQAGSTFELTWRNDELTETPSAKRPETKGVQHTQQSTMVVFEPPHRLAYNWGHVGDVEFTLAQEGAHIRLTLIHRRIPDRATLLGVGAGWHAHLDFLVARLSGATMEPFWDRWGQLQDDYAQRLFG